MVSPRSGVNAVFGLAVFVARTWIAEASSAAPLVSLPVPLSTSATVNCALPAVLVRSAVTDAS